ncbi:MAG TPA: PglZ domain-containing protein [Verrucomicrobiae bacterium]|nr:PglZ domain-containing protein [Verrucomicrobiae bacterium]
MKNLDSCSEWMLEELVALSKGNERVWVRDPDRLLSASVKDIQNTLGAEQQVFLILHSLGLRSGLLRGLPRRWVVVDQSNDGRGHSILFAPDLRRLIDGESHTVRTVRDFLVSQTSDPGWPQEVESFPYRELAREHPADFIRAYEDFRAGKPVGFSSLDLLLIGASAVLQRNLFALENPFVVIELAFHSEVKWKHLADYFGAEEIQAIREHLRQLPKPLGDLFGGQAQSARLACAALLILSPHVENPGQYLPNLSASLNPWQDSEPLFAATPKPAWFDVEVDLFDSAVSPAFLKTIKTVLGLDAPEKEQAFAKAECWSSKLRQLVVLAAPGRARGEQPATDTGDLEQLVPVFRARFAEVTKLIGSTRATCDRLRARHPSQLKIGDFTSAFCEQGLHRLAILSAELKSRQTEISRTADRPPGFEERWKKMEAEVDNAITEVEELLKDFDFVLGRFLEVQFAQVVPKQITPTNQIIERLVADRKTKHPEQPVAIILLDGMRYDLWQMIVRPHLERRYRVQEQVGIAMLPSETKISRAGFFSGLKPADYFGKGLPGGEIEACNRLLKKLLPNHKDVGRWDVDCGQVPFAFRSADEKIFGIVFDFADAVGHASAWEIDLLADLVKVWLKQVDKVLKLLPADCELWVTADHGQVISGTSPIDIPAGLLAGDGNGYRSALLKDRLTGQHANHVFHLRARDLGYDQDGYWIFPKPGFSFRLQSKAGGTTSKFKPTDNMRHSGLSAFEIFVPIAQLTSRKRQFRVTLAPRIIGAFRVGVPTQLVVEISADSAVSGLIEIRGDADGLQPAMLTNVGPTAQSVELPFTPQKSGTITINLEPRWGYNAVPSSTTVTIQVAEALARTADELDDKLKKLLG